MSTTKTIFIEYNDESEFHFDVTIEGTETQIIASLMMITRGTLMASNGIRATCYNDEGFEICSYSK